MWRVILINEGFLEVHPKNNNLFLTDWQTTTYDRDWNIKVNYRIFLIWVIVQVIFVDQYEIYEKQISHHFIQDTHQPHRENLFIKMVSELNQIPLKTSKTDQSKFEFLRKRICFQKINLTSSCEEEIYWCRWYVFFGFLVSCVKISNDLQNESTPYRYSFFPHQIFMSLYWALNWDEI